MVESLKGQNGKSALELLIEAKELPQKAQQLLISSSTLKAKMVRMVAMVHPHTRLNKDLAQKAQDAAVAAAKLMRPLKGLNEADTEAAIQAAKDANPVATQEQWLDSIKGQDGKDGSNGASAYETYKDLAQKAQDAAVAAAKLMRP